MTLGMSLLGESQGQGHAQAFRVEGVRRDTLAYYTQHVG